MSSNRDGSKAGSKNVTAQSTGGEWHASDAGDSRGGGNSPIGSTKPIHGKSKATRVLPLNAPTNAENK